MLVIFKRRLVFEILIFLLIDGFGFCVSSGKMESKRVVLSEIC